MKVTKTFSIKLNHLNQYKIDWLNNVYQKANQLSAELLNHKLSRQVIDFCVEQNVDILVLEELKGHHLSNRKYRKYSWAYKQLQNFIEYKAKMKGIQIEYVNPAYSSQKCSTCGLISKRFRSNQSKFECSNGHRFNAGYNAAKNLVDFFKSSSAIVNLAIGNSQITKSDTGIDVSVLHQENMAIC